MMALMASMRRKAYSSTAPWRSPSGREGDDTLFGELAPSVGVRRWGSPSQEVYVYRREQDSVDYIAFKQCKPFHLNIFVQKAINLATNAPLYNSHERLVHVHVAIQGVRVRSQINSSGIKNNPKPKTTSV